MNILTKFRSILFPSDLCHSCRFDFNNPTWHIGGYNWESDNGEIVRKKNGLIVSGTLGVRTATDLDLSLKDVKEISFYAENAIAPTLHYHTIAWEFKSAVSCVVSKNKYIFGIHEHDVIHRIYIMWETKSNIELSGWSLHYDKIVKERKTVETQFICNKCTRAIMMVGDKSLYLHSLPELRKVMASPLHGKIGVFYFTNYSQGLGDMTWRQSLLQVKHSYDSTILICDDVYLDLYYGQPIDEFWLVPKEARQYDEIEEILVSRELRKLKEFDFILPCTEQRHSQNRFAEFHKIIRDKWTIKRKYPAMVYPNPMYIDSITKYIDDERRNIICHARLAIWSSERNWREDNWIELTGLASGKYNVIMIGGPADVRTKPMPESIIDLHQKLSLGQIIALMSLSDLYVGIDGGVTNVAAAAGMSRITILGEKTYKDHGRGEVVELIGLTENAISPQEVYEAIDTFFEA